MIKDKEKMIIKLSYSGHYPDVFVEITEAEYKDLVALTEEGAKYLFDTEEGRDKIQQLINNKKIDRPYDKTFIAYM